MTGAFTEGGNGLKDYGFDQLVDQSKVGTKYIFKKGDGNTDTENVLLVATTDNTSITINGNPVTTATRGKRFLKSISVSDFADEDGDDSGGLAGPANPFLTTTTITAGEYFLIEGDKYDGNGNMYVETSKPVYAFQGISPNGGQQVGLFFAPPLKCSPRRCK